ncbi:MAG: dihydroneopterin aldolase [Acetobacter sp.]|nr:dihydroneopterin aldolase [Bacteroides sp.]MCM1340367.1 dihydroneopterin aldolase [Acetobacter sp.]MCM1432986.1 dihydroneopterin aldolase [Clostridiales bacterium]
MDKILIRDLKLFAYHGVNPEEKEDGQNFYFDIDLYVNITKACHSDNVDDTVSYAKVIKTVRRVFTAEKYDLIEKAAQVTADAILDEYNDVSRVDITLKKPEAPMKADFGWVGVHIERAR